MLRATPSQEEEDLGQMKWCVLEVTQLQVLVKILETPYP